MNYYFAPMEGVTGYIYRNAHRSFYQGVDKYFSPFIYANQSDSFKTKEMQDILPENNQGLTLIPQLLTNKAADFIYVSKKLKELGYQEINLNLGCPSGTVVSKNRGSGFLAKTEDLDAFLAEIFSSAVTEITIKTRLGKEEPEEFYRLLEIFNQYPMKELIIHPRVQKDYYKNTPNRKVFADAVKLSRNHICYNGDIFSPDTYQSFVEDFPEVDTVMLGRGLIANPGFIECISSKSVPEKAKLKEFHDRLLSDYQKVLFGDRNVLFKMKEVWFYMIHSFTNPEKYSKKIKKSERVSDYKEAVESLFGEQELIEQPSYQF